MSEVLFIYSIVVEDNKQPDPKTDKPSPEAAPASGEAPSTEVVADEEPELSLEELDAFLVDADPEFASALEDVSKDNSLQSAVLDSVGNLSNHLQNANLSLRQRIQNTIVNIRNWSILKKGAFVFLLSCCAATIYFIYFVWTKGLHFEEKPMFVTQFSKYATKTETWKDAGELEAFYDSLHFEKYLFLFPKLIVNLTRKSGEPDSNPMVAMELFAETTAEDTILEIKSRETEFKDLLLRTLEEQTFEQLDTTEGKKKYLDQAKREVNSRLAHGRVRKLSFRNFVLKP